MFGSARRTWVLGGGGARGAAQVGVLQALFEANVEPPAAVVGTSVGALNGASIAAYP
ncbi:MAG: patatin-like phospholipase family protein, partial [Chloroflexi bacterium]